MDGREAGSESHQKVRGKGHALKAWVANTVHDHGKESRKEAGRRQEANPENSMPTSQSRGGAQT